MLDICSTDKLELLIIVNGWTLDTFEFELINSLNPYDCIHIPYRDT